MATHEKDEFLDELRKARVDAKSVHASLLEALRLTQKHDLGKESAVCDTASLVERAVRKLDDLVPDESPTCFPLSAPIIVPGGTSPIGSLRVGDQVLGWPELPHLRAAKW